MVNLTNTPEKVEFGAQTKKRLYIDMDGVLVDFESALPRVLMEQGRSLSQKMIRNRVRRTARRTGLAQQGVHILRLTFCSHLSMRGAPVAAIHALAVHADLATTQRYMHLNLAAMKDAIGLLERTNPDLAGER